MGACLQLPAHARRDWLFCLRTGPNSLMKIQLWLDKVSKGPKQSIRRFGVACVCFSDTFIFRILVPLSALTLSQQ